ncbi:MAG: hypothetical protein GWN14_05235 [candidate division Zixibacteria bacterium]|nr:hypothetical protein [candidate division Zixibacteria bacterium]
MKVRAITREYFDISKQSLRRSVYPGMSYISGISQHVGYDKLEDGITPNNDKLLNGDSVLVRDVVEVLF